MNADQIVREFFSDLREQDKKYTNIKSSKVVETKNLTKILRNMVNSDTMITCKLHEPYMTVGSITMHGTCVSVTDTKMLAKIAREMSDNFSVIPHRDGTISAIFTLTGLAELEDEYGV